MLLNLVLVLALLLPDFAVAITPPPPARTPPKAGIGRLGSTLRSRRAKDAAVIPDAYILQMEPVRTGAGRLGKRAATRAEQAKAAAERVNAVLNSVSAQKINYSLRQTFTSSPSSFLGASIRLSTLNTTREDLLALPGVVAVWPVHHYPRPKLHVGAEQQQGEMEGMDRWGKEVDARVLDAGDSSSRRERRRRRNHRRSPITTTTLLKKRQFSPLVGSSYSRDIYPPHVQTGIDKLQSSGHLGTGVKVGILDTGVDYKNPILGGCFGEGCHVSFGYDFVGDSYTGSNSPLPSSDPYTTCDPHGTHVTGIVGALQNSYSFSGVAPNATLGHYRIFGCEGTTPDDVILAALVKRREDGCGVLSLSLGAPMNWLDSTAVEAYINILSEEGIAVTVAASNDGEEGLFFGSEAAASSRQFAVGSVQNSDITTFYARISNSRVPVPYQAQLPFNIPAQLPLQFTSLFSTTANDGCNALPAATNFRGGVVVVQRGGCTFVQKMQNLKARNASVVLIYNAANEGPLPYLSVGSTGLTNVGGLTRETGLLLLSYFRQSRGLKMSFSSNALAPGTKDPSGGLINSFSTFGPTFDLAPAVTFSAPGGNILSTVPLSFGGLAVISGTSMATPFAAGAIAVLKAARPQLSIAQIRSILATTASRVGDATNSSIASVVQQGGGLIQVYKASRSSVVISPAMLAVGDSTRTTSTFTISLQNIGTTAISFSASSTRAETLATFALPGDNLPTLSPPILPQGATVSFPQGNSITVPAGGTASLQVLITPPADDARLPVFSGFIDLVSTSSESYSVPYLGLAGTIKSAPVLDRTDAYFGPGGGLTFPFLLDTSSTVQSTPKAYKRNSGPTLFFRLAMGTPHLTVDLVLADTIVDGAGSYAAVETIANIFSADILTRDSFAEDNGYSSVTFSGYYPDASGKQVKTTAGTPYQLLLRGLRLGGDRTHQGDYDSWLSPTFTYVS